MTRAKGKTRSPCDNQQGVKKGVAGPHNWDEANEFSRSLHSNAATPADRVQSFAVSRLYGTTRDVLN